MAGPTVHLNLHVSLDGVCHCRISPTARTTARSTSSTRRAGRPVQFERQQHERHAVPVTAAISRASYVSGPLSEVRLVATAGRPLHGPVACTRRPPRQQYRRRIADNARNLASSLTVPSRVRMRSIRPAVAWRQPLGLPNRLFSRPARSGQTHAGSSGILLTAWFAAPKCKWGSVTEP